MIILRTKAFRDFKSHAFFFQLIQNCVNYFKSLFRATLLINVTHVFHTFTFFPIKDL